MFILKTSPQQSYAFKEGIGFAHSWICFSLFFIKKIYRLGNHFCGHTGGINIILCLLFYVQKNKVTTPHLDYLT